MFIFSDYFCDGEFYAFDKIIYFWVEIFFEK